uniref:Ribitol-5-phosphate transferase FKTN N-terminal domain-containing protein n=1 Tax=Fundulus heteroclitus TaxID=8078 RepID=A0A3Q2NX76_FUNHE
MPRVNRTLVFVLLLVSSCAFLLFQLYYYRNYVSKVRGGGRALRPGERRRAGSPS